MANILDYLRQIKDAVYGKDVRSSIYNALYEMNDQIEKFVEIPDGSVTPEKTTFVSKGTDGKYVLRDDFKINDDIGILKQDLADTYRKSETYSKTEVDNKLNAAGKVKSVNGKIGDVVITAEDIGYHPPVAEIEQTVRDWLDDHPEATTTVADRSITEEKLSDDLVKKINSDNFIINPEKWEIDTTGETDSTVQIQAAVDYAYDNGYHLVTFPYSASIKVSHQKPASEALYSDSIYGGIILRQNTEYDLNGSTITMTTNSDIGYNILLIDPRAKNHSIEAHGLMNNITVRNGKLIGDRRTHDYSALDTQGKASTHEFGFGVCIHNGRNIKIIDVDMEQFSGDCIFIGQSGNLSTDYTDGVIIKGCKLDYARRNVISPCESINVTIEDCWIGHAGGTTDCYDGIQGTDPMFGIDIEPYGNGVDGLPMKSDNVVIKGCHFQDCYRAFIGVPRCEHVFISNCTFDNANTIAYHKEYLFYSGGGGKAMNIDAKMDNCVFTNCEGMVFNGGCSSITNCDFGDGSRIDIQCPNNVGDAYFVNSKVSEGIVRVKGGVTNAFVTNSEFKNFGEGSFGTINTDKILYDNCIFNDITTLPYRSGKYTKISNSVLSLSHTTDMVSYGSGILEINNCDIDDYRATRFSSFAPNDANTDNVRFVSCDINVKHGIIRARIENCYIRPKFIAEDYKTSNSRRFESCHFYNSIIDFREFFADAYQSNQETGTPSLTQMAWTVGNKAVNTTVLFTANNGNMSINTYSSDWICCNFINDGTISNARCPNHTKANTNTFVNCFWDRCAENQY